MPGVKYDAKKERFDLVPVVEWKQIVGSKPETGYRIAESFVDYLVTKDVVKLINIGHICIAALGSNQFAAMRKLAALYTFGAERYGDNNWKQLDSCRFINALGRHIEDLESGSIYDSETGMHQCVHILWNVISILYRRGINDI